MRLQLGPWQLPLPTQWPTKRPLVGRAAVTCSAPLLGCWPCLLLSRHLEAQLPGSSRYALGRPTLQAWHGTLTAFCRPLPLRATLRGERGRRRRQRVPRCRRLEPSGPSLQSTWPREACQRATAACMIALHSRWVPRVATCCVKVLMGHQVRDPCRLAALPLQHCLSKLPSVAGPSASGVAEASSAALPAVAVGHLGYRPPSCARCHRSKWRSASCLSTWTPPACASCTSIHPCSPCPAFSRVSRLPEASEVPVWNCQYGAAGVCRLVGSVPVSGTQQRVLVAPRGIDCTSSRRADPIGLLPPLLQRISATMRWPLRWSPALWCLPRSASLLAACGHLPAGLPRLCGSLMRCCSSYSMACFAAAAGLSPLLPLPLPLRGWPHR